MDLQLSGRVALVSGGSRGIGRASALELARAGCDVAVFARGAAELRGVEAEVTGLGRRGLACVVDVTDTQAMTTAYGEVVAKLGAPTVLVLSHAGFFKPTKLHMQQSRDLTSSLATDLTSAVELCRLALPAMMDARFGRIVAIGSLAARSGIAGGTLYAVAKAGLEGLIHGLTVDYARRGISANLVAAGFADSERLKARVDGDEKARERLVNATATRRISTVEEIADVVTFLCSPRAKSISGAIVDATAGSHLNNLW